VPLADKGLKMAGDSEALVYHNWPGLFMDVSAAIADVQATDAGLEARGQSEGKSFLSPRATCPSPVMR